MLKCVATMPMWRCDPSKANRPNYHTALFLFFKGYVMKTFMKDIVNKNTIITSNAGGGSSSLALFFTEFLSNYYNVLYFDTGHLVDRAYIKKHYPNVHENVFILQSSIDDFFNYLSELNRNIVNIDYIIIDTGDMLNKATIQALNSLLKEFNINMICTSQLRVNPNNARPYSTVEEWNKQLSDKPFQNSIWIRNVNEPGTLLTRKYIDVFKDFRVGNRYYKRIILNFDKRNGSIS